MLRRLAAYSAALTVLTVPITMAYAEQLTAKKKRASLPAVQKVRDAAGRSATKSDPGVAWISGMSGVRGNTKAPARKQAR